MEIEGADKVKNKNGFIVIMNHQSSLDVLGLKFSIPNLAFQIFKLSIFLVMANLIFILGNLSPCVKKELLLLPPLAYAIYLCDGLFLDRLKKDSSVKALEKKCEDLKLKKVKINQNVSQPYD